MQLQTKFIPAGVPIPNISLLEAAWDEFPELQLNPRDLWVGNSLAALQASPKWVVYAVHQGEVVGGLVIYPEPWECHVGACAVVSALYVLPAFRGKLGAMLFREAVRIVRYNSLEVLAFTHRKGPFKYETIYKEIQ